MAESTPGCTKLNLKADVEDHAPKFGMSPNLEFRMAGEPLETEESAIRGFMIPARNRPR